MNKKELSNLLIVLNSTNDLGFKYPFGNKELTETVKKLELEQKIKYDSLTGKWTK